MRSTWSSILKINCFLTIFPIFASGTIYNAQVELEELFTTQHKVIEAFNQYLENEHLRLKMLKKKILSLERLGNNKNPHQVSINPISSYKFLQRIVNDFNGIMKSVENKQNLRELVKSLQPIWNEDKLASNDDVAGAALALSKLRQTYKLSAVDVANGNLIWNGRVFSTSDKLDKVDLFYIGRETYNEDEFEESIIWMKEALNFDRAESFANQTKEEWKLNTRAKEYIAFAYYQNADYKNAIKYTKELIKENPDGIINNWYNYYYEFMIRENILKEKLLKNNKISKPTAKELEFKTYQSLCREEFAQKTPKPLLTCQYFHRENHYLRISPVKQEQVHANPDIWVFHEIISESEVAALKNLSTPTLSAATIYDGKLKKWKAGKGRVGKFSWHQPYHHPVVEAIDLRIGLITGLNMNYAEQLQIANYGLGGYYEPHGDFATKDLEHIFDFIGAGNRIATFLLYLTGVEVGGSTVFTQLDLNLAPVERGGVFWYNLIHDGSGDLRTRHAACPVLVGSKWIGNKWIHERGQEFRRPCNKVWRNRLWKNAY